MAKIDRNVLFRSFDEQKDLMEDRIQLGIESYRKGYGRLNFVDKAGQPVRGAKVSVRQKSHDFKFGANIFKLNCFDTQEENQRYEEAFVNLFNYAITPFYWNTFEPEEGKMRFDKDSPFIDRRPTPEAVLEFCRKHDIRVKGHPLFWALMLPDWLPHDQEALKPYLSRRLQQIAARYDGVIDCFDCVNESTEVPLLREEPNVNSRHYRNSIPLDGNYVAWVFRQADRFFLNSPLVINETTSVWLKFKQELSPFYMQIENLLSQKCRVDKVGLQYHLFVPQEQYADGASQVFNPSHLYAVMDCYSRLGKPLQITEITVPGYGDNGDDIQAEALYNLYRIWFSQRDVEAIVYWNLGDNCAIVQDGWAEDKYKGGLLRSDFSEKPSYAVLQTLIQKEWQTNLDLETADSFLYFKGFYGQYEITAEREGQIVTRELRLSKKGFDTFTLTFP
jgi:GH35 family endo-1,4-beta-xylanase